MDRTIWMIFLALTTNIAFMAGFSLYLADPVKRRLKLKPELFSFITENVLYLIWIASMLLFTRGLPSQPFSDYRQPTDWWNYLIVFFANFAGVFLIVLLTPLDAALSGKKLSEYGSENEPSHIYNTLILLFIAPLVEELIFRYFMGRLVIHHGLLFFLLFSAVSFALFHLNNLKISLVAFTFWGGLMWSWVYLASGSIRLATLYHIASNFLLGCLPEKFPEKIQFPFRGTLALLGLGATVYMALNLKSFLFGEDPSRIGPVFAEIFTHPGPYLLILVSLLAGYLIQKKRASHRKKEKAQKES